MKNLNQILKQELMRRKLKNKHYSMRKFAQDLGISAAVLSRVLNNKIVVSKSSMDKIAKKSPFFKQLVASQEKRNNSTQESESFYQFLTKEQTQVFKRWYVSAILQMITVPGFSKDVKWIASTLGLVSAEVEVCIDVLIKSGLLIIDENLQWKPNYSIISTLAVQPTNKELVELQIDFFTKTIESLQRQPISLRDHSTVVFSMNIEDLPVIKEKIKRFRRSLAKFCESKPIKKRNAVYQLSTGLSPLYLQK